MLSDMITLGGPDDRTRQAVLPVRILRTQGDVEEARHLLSPAALQITTAEPEVTVLANGPDGEQAAVLLDFGTELNGGCRLLTHTIEGASPARIHVTFVESSAEACSQIGEKNATNDHAPRDFSMPLPAYSDVTVGETGFRFLCIRLESPSTRLRLKAATAIAVYRDLPYLGRFRCDRERLNQIYDTAAYTCHLCMQQYIWDGIKRDRLVWIGDLHPEMLTVRTVFGPQPLLADTLRFSRETTPLPGWMNNMPTYSLWWLRILYDWYWYTGSRAFLTEHRDYALALIRQILAVVHDDGRDALPDYFLDWPSHERPEEKDSSRALLAQALDAAARLAALYDEPALADLCEQKRAALGRQPAACYGSKQAAAMLALAGWMTEEEAASVICQDGCRRFSTFMSYYLLRVAARGRDMTTALSLLETYYGGMLDRGATTFWEDFNIDWLENSGRIDEPVPAGMSDIHGDHGAFCYEGFRHSLCHGWSSGPTAFLAEEVLGIHILEAGCRKIGLSPQLGDLRWAEGTYPTPLGLLRVRCRRNEDGRILTDWEAPDGMEVILQP